MLKTIRGAKVSESHWDSFTNYAVENGISLDDEEDWGPWWDCWIDGFMHGGNS